MKMETYRIIASSGRTTLQGKTQDYVMLIGLSINFHLHYLEALKKNLLPLPRHQPADCAGDSYRGASGTLAPA
jgi:hypothetical protein